MIEIKDLSFHYEIFDEDEEINMDNEVINVIDNLSLNIPSNKYVCILGHNGSGKSTLAKLLIGLIKPQSGEIYIDNKLLTPENVMEIRSDIGIVFQNPDNQFIGSSVEDDIAFGLENQCVDPSLMPGIIKEYATKVGMQDFLGHEPTRLSGGQKQRVAIAGILATKPKIMIFDEATSMLDPKGRNEVNESILELKNENKTIISITHDIEQAVYADHIIVMNKGKVLMQGNPHEVFKQSDKLIEVGLNIPFALQVSKALNKDNQTNLNCLDIDEIGEILCQ